jgi:hypothetical protein
MMIRAGVASIKYSHDSEAAFAAMRMMREFAFLSDNTLQDFIIAAENYTSQYYWYDPEFDAFTSVQTRFYHSVAHLRRVCLYNFGALTRRVVEKLGFSCLYCGQHTIYAPEAMAQWAYVPREIEHTARHRQSLHCPLLLCASCGRALSVLFRGEGTTDHPEVLAMLDRLSHGAGTSNVSGRI